MKILNPIHYDYFSENISAFLDIIVKINEKKQNLINIDEIIKEEYGEFYSYLFTTQLTDIKHPFSKELLDQINQLTIRIIDVNDKENKLSKKNKDKLINYSLVIFLHDCLEVMDNYPNIKPTDIEIDV